MIPWRPQLLSACTPPPFPPACPADLGPLSSSSLTLLSVRVRAGESNQPSFRRFHVPCRQVVPGRVPPASDPVLQEEDRQLAKQLVALMPSVSGFTNVLDANAGTGTFGIAMR